VAVAIGVLAAWLLRALTPAPVRPFADAWPVLPDPVQPLALILAAALALVVFGARRR
jgi:hypothetical protein